MVKRKHIFPQESYKCFTSKALLREPPPTLVTSKKLDVITGDYLFY